MKEHSKCSSNLANPGAYQDGLVFWDFIMFKIVCSMELFCLFCLFVWHVFIATWVQVEFMFRFTLLVCFATWVTWNMS